VYIRIVSLSTEFSRYRAMKDVRMMQDDVRKPKRMIQDTFAAEAEWIIHEQNVVKRIQRHLNNNNELEANLDWTVRGSTKMDGI
jgi:hypothetical protein